MNKEMYTGSVRQEEPGDIHQEHHRQSKSYREALPARFLYHSAITCGNAAEVWEGECQVCADE